MSKGEQQHRENVTTFKRVKEMHQVIDGLGQLIANAMYLSVKPDTVGPEHARKVADIHIGQLTTFLNDCNAAAQQGDTKTLLSIIEDWKGTV